MRIRYTIQIVKIEHTDDFWKVIKTDHNGEITEVKIDDLDELTKYLKSRVD